MLLSVTLQNFKSFVDERAGLAPFTLLVGANASGKSNFLDALRLLHGLAHGWSLQDVAGGKVEGSTRLWSGIRGGTRELVRLGGSEASVHTNWMIAGDHYTHTLRTDGTTISSERVGNLFEAAQDVRAAATRIEWQPGAMVQGEQTELWQPAGARSVITSVRTPWLGYLAGTVRGVRFVDLTPSEIHDRYVEKPNNDRQLTPSSSGDNLSGVLWQLCQTDQRREIADWLTEFCGPEIRDLDFEVTESGYVMLRIIDRQGQRITARSMSDGTLRFLGLLAHLKTARRGDHVVIEEPERGLHPQRCRLLVEAIAAATEPELPTMASARVIATTHSADVVEAALEIPHATVLLFAQRPGGGSIIRDVRSLPRFEEVRKQRDFSYLLNTGWLERAV